SPGFCRPMAFSMPDDVSATRGVGLPRRVSTVVALIMMAPSWDRSYSCAYSLPKPKQPDAGMIGFFNVSPGRFIVISIMKSPHPPQIQDRTRRRLYNTYLISWYGRHRRNTRRCRSPCAARRKGIHVSAEMPIAPLQASPSAHSCNTDRNRAAIHPGYASQILL